MLVWHYMASVEKTYGNTIPHSGVHILTRNSNKDTVQAGRGSEKAL